jgi:hypothetical protein
VLRLADKVVIFGTLQGARIHLRLGQPSAASVSLGPGLRRRLWHRWGRFYRPRRIRVCGGGRVQQSGDTRRRSEPVDTSPAGAAGF